MNIKNKKMLGMGGGGGGVVKICWVYGKKMEKKKVGHFKKPNAYWSRCFVPQNASPFVKEKLSVIMNPPCNVNNG
jgi:hypothetical protein